MSQYVLSLPDGILYACGDACASAVFEILARSGSPAISMEWSTGDRDVFCAGCATPLGWRRASALLLHSELTGTAKALYTQIHDRWWRDVAAR